MFLNRGPWCILILIFILTAHAQAQFLKGRILDNISQKPVPRAVIYEWGTGHFAITDEAGFFELHFPSDMETVMLQITAEAYETFSIHLRVQDWNPDTQEFFLFQANSILELALETNQAVSDDEAGEDEVFSLLHSARDPVKDAASFQFGSFRYRLRGVSGIYDQLGFNGFLLNDPVTGYLPFYLFSGQSLLTKYGDDYLSYKDNPADFGSSGLAQWITSKPTSYRKELSLRYAHANRSYDNRLDLFYSSGPLSRGWGVIAGVNRRWAQEAFSPGSYYDAWGGFAGLSKELGSKHQLQLTAVYAPVIRGKASPATLEVYELAGDPYYNSYWGYQQGEKRNSRWSDRSVPMLTLNYNGRLNDHLSWSAGCLGLSGTFADGQLDWYNAPDPRPDYYQKLPSYIQDSAVADAVRLSWKVNPNVRQINWDRMYQINYNNQDTIRNANGLPGHTVTGRRAAYWLSERHADPSEIEHFASVKYSKGRHDLMLGYRGEGSKTRYYLNAYDLLGADFMVDLEDFASLPEQQHPDIRQKNHVIREGDRYGYDYSAHNHNYAVHGNYGYAARKWDAAIGALVQRRSFYRKSDLENAIFQNSYGKSETVVETGFGLKTLLTWKFNGRNYVQANGAYQMLPNRFDQSFINPQWRGDVLEHNDRTKVYGLDIGYYYRDPGLKIQLTAYWLRYEDQILNKNFYLDDQLESASNAELTDGSLISAFFTGLDQQHRGVEAAVEWNVGWGFELSGVYMLGDHRYTSRPEFVIFDKFSKAESRHVIYLRNFFVPGTALQAASFSLTYNFRKSGFAVLSFANALSDQYLEPNPLRRIPEAVRDVDPASAQFRGIIDQQKLPTAYFVNAFVYKGFKIFKQNLSMSLSVNNLLNKKDILSGGFEQYRFDYETRDPSKFPPKYYYLQGINYYLGINWRYDFSK